MVTEVVSGSDLRLSLARTHRVEVSPHVTIAMAGNSVRLGQFLLLVLHWQLLAVDERAPLPVPRLTTHEKASPKGRSDPTTMARPGAQAGTFGTQAQWPDPSPGGVLCSVSLDKQHPQQPTQALFFGVAHGGGPGSKECCEAGYPGSSLRTRTQCVCLLLLLV